ncbi:MAG: urea transporter [Pseudomonadota bacterium]
MQFQSRPSVPAWRPAVPSLLQAPLAGIGQIYFQSSPLFGALLLGCLYLTAPAMAAGCLLGVCVANGTAWALDFPEDARHAGLYGFNGALSGVGLCAAYSFNVALLCWITLAGMATAMLARAMSGRGLPPLTSLFVLVMWLARAAGPMTGLAPNVAQGIALLPAGAAAGCGMAPLAYVFCAVGQASFVAAVPLGMLLWTALARGRWHLGVWTLGGAALAWGALALAPLVAPAWPVAALATGMGVNCALTLLGLTVHGRAWRWRCAGGLASVALCVACAALGLAFYTLPFVLSVWLVLAASRAK